MKPSTRSVWTQQPLPFDPDTAMKTEGITLNGRLRLMFKPNYYAIGAKYVARYKVLNKTAYILEVSELWHRNSTN